MASNDLRLATMLTKFFDANKRSEDARAHLYSKFPQHYLWDGVGKMWIKRKQKPEIGRLTYVGPSEGERYYLRLLLCHVRGPTSFKDLLTVNGHTYLTFQEAAQKRDLLEDTDYVDSCMNEAMQFQMPSALRRLFASFVNFLHTPLALFEKYFVGLSENFERRYKENTPQISLHACSAIERYLQGMGKSLKDYNLGHLLHPLDSLFTATHDITDALNAPIPAMYVNAPKLLNAGQRVAYKCIIQHIKTNTPDAFFVDGPDGTSNSFLYCALYSKVRSMGQIVLPTATSGIASSNIPTGRTTHSRFKIPIGEDISSTYSISKQSSVA